MYLSRVEPTISWPQKMNTEYPTWRAHGSVSTSEKYASKGRAKPKPKPTLPNLCWIVLLGNSHLYHAGAGLGRWRSSLRITDAIVYLNSHPYRLQLRQYRLCICNRDLAWILLDCNRCDIVVFQNHHHSAVGDVRLEWYEGLLVPLNEDLPTTA